VRGDYGNFMLIVDHENLFSDNIIFPSFDDSVSTYFVAEPVELSFAPSSEIPTSTFQNYDHAFVLGKYLKFIYLFIYFLLKKGGNIPYAT
jgi:hypothetical protein